MSDDDDLDEYPESPDSSDMDQNPDNDDSVDTVDCPNCGKQIYDQAAICPFCRNHVVVGSHRYHRKPLWFVLAAIVCLLLILFWIIR